LANVTLEPAFINVDAPTAFETYSSGLDLAKELDALDFEVHGKKTHYAREWRRKYGKFEKKEVSQ